MENKSLPRYYTILFNAVTDAIQALDRQDFGQARALLVRELPSSPILPCWGWPAA